MILFLKSFGFGFGKSFKVHEIETLNELWLEFLEILQSCVESGRKLQNITVGLDKEGTLSNLVPLLYNTFSSWVTGMIFLSREKTTSSLRSRLYNLFLVLIFVWPLWVNISNTNCVAGRSGSYHRTILPSSWQDSCVGHTIIPSYGLYHHSYRVIQSNCDK